MASITSCLTSYSFFPTLTDIGDRWIAYSHNGFIKVLYNFRHRLVLYPPRKIPKDFIKRCLEMAFPILSAVFSSIIPPFFIITPRYSAVSDSAISSPASSRFLLVSVRGARTHHFLGEHVRFLSPLCGCNQHILYSIPPLIEYRPWTGLVFNSGNIQYAGGLSYSIIPVQVATCPRYIFGSRLANVYSTLLSQMEMHYIVKHDSTLVWQ